MPFVLFEGRNHHLNLRGVCGLPRTLGTYFKSRPPHISTPQLRERRGVANTGNHGPEVPCRMNDLPKTSTALGQTHLPQHNFLGSSLDLRSEMPQEMIVFNTAQHRGVEKPARSQAAAAASQRQRHSECSLRKKRSGRLGDGAVLGGCTGVTGHPGEKGVGSR